MLDAGGGGQLRPGDAGDNLVLPSFYIMVMRSECCSLPTPSRQQNSMDTHPPPFFHLPQDEAKPSAGPISRKRSSSTASGGGGSRPRSSSTSSVRSGGGGGHSAPPPPALGMHPNLPYHQPPYHPHHHAPPPFGFAPPPPPPGHHYPPLPPPPHHLPHLGAGFLDEEGDDATSMGGPDGSEGAGGGVNSGGTTPRAG